MKKIQATLDRPTTAREILRTGTCLLMNEVIKRWARQLCIPIKVMPILLPDHSVHQGINLAVDWSNDKAISEWDEVLPDSRYALNTSGNI